MSDLNSVAVLAIAAGLDYLIGDPWNWIHPVQVMGWAIAGLSGQIFRSLKTPFSQKIAGILLALALIVGSGLIGWLIIRAIAAIPAPFPLHPILDIGVQSILLASCFAGRSLRRAAEEVRRPLEAGDLPTARSQLSRYVGRDTEDLSEAEIRRAILETITENATDGVMAPLFYGILGLAVPAIGSVPLAIAYKAASTVDSMVGYREAPYTDIGWFGARLEDVLTWLPCRLTVFSVALLSGRPGRVWQICRRDAIHDPSPNAGWSECAYAAALGVQLGGANRYRGQVKHKPKLGDPIHPIASETIDAALQITRSCIFLWLGVAIAIVAIVG